MNKDVVGASRFLLKIFLHIYPISQSPNLPISPLYPLYPLFPLFPIPNL